jgi:hypothetical protein
MTQTLLFNLGDVRLSPDERMRLLRLSTDLAKRPFDEPSRDRAPDNRALEAQHFRVDRGDL